MNATFLKFLENTPSALVKMVDIASEWYKIQQELPQERPDTDGPVEFHAGEIHALRTTGIAVEELDEIAKGYATAIVKEKAMQYVKGFIAGVMFVS